MSERFNEPNFEVKVSVRHSMTRELVSRFSIQQSVRKTKGGWFQATLSVQAEIERLNAIDGFIYICLFPDWHSWRLGGGGVTLCEWGNYRNG